MSQFFRYIILSAFIGLILQSCADSVVQQNAGVTMKKKEELEIKHALDSLSNVEFDTFYTKLSTDYEDSAQDVSFKTSLRIASDSVISAIVTFVRIPVASALITRDSIKVSNKREKCYVFEDLEYLRNQFGMDLDYHNVEELFMGLPVGYDPAKKYFRVKDNLKEFQVCTHRKGQIKQNERRVKREIITYYTLTPDKRDLKSMRIYSPDDDALVNVTYDEREMVDGYNLPKEMKIRIQTPKQEIKIDLEYKKVRINEKEKFHFVIPESYVKCK